MANFGQGECTEKPFDSNFFSVKILIETGHQIKGGRVNNKMRMTAIGHVKIIIKMFLEDITFSDFVKN